MDHYQISKVCGVCGKGIIADVFSSGTEHQTIIALTHADCAVHIFQGMKQMETRLDDQKAIKRPTPEANPTPTL